MIFIELNIAFWTIYHKFTFPIFIYLVYEKFIVLFYNTLNTKRPLTSAKANIRGLVIERSTDKARYIYRVGDFTFFDYSPLTILNL